MVDQYRKSQGVSPNMTPETSSKSPKHGTSIRAVAWRDSSASSADENNGHLGFGTKEKRNKG